MPSRSPWHVSPWVDLLAYHFSWLWILIPLKWSGETGVQGFVGTWSMILVLTITFVHRHISLPYAYLDPDVYRAHRPKLFWLPLLALPLFLLTPFAADRSPEIDTSFNGLIFVAVLWNAWHTLMQKYGILRLYNSKTGLPIASRVPARADRFLIWSWIPLFAVYIGPKYQHLVAQNAEMISPISGPIFAALSRWQPILLPAALLFLLFGIGQFLWYERRCHGLRNLPRLSMASGLMAAFSCFLFIDPIHVYLALGFSHAIEYIVFVGAFLKNKYASPSTQASPWLTRVARRPWRNSILFVVLLAAAYFVPIQWGRKIMVHKEPLALLGFTAQTWIFYFGIYESLLHFYFDGFLWKIRRPELVAYL